MRLPGQDPLSIKLWARRVWTLELSLVSLSPWQRLRLSFIPEQHKLIYSIPFNPLFR